MASQFFFHKLVPSEVVQSIKDAMYIVYDRQLNDVGGLENLKK